MPRTCSPCRCSITVTDTTTARQAPVPHAGPGSGAPRSGRSAAAFTSLLPLSGDQYGVYGTQFEDGNGYDVFRYVMTPGYCQTMGIALRRGRLLDEHDTSGAPPAVLIGESLAKRQFPGQDPIGRRVHVGPLNRPWYTIVGVVGDVKQGSLADSQADAVYITPAQSWFADDAMSLVVRARDDVTALAPAIKNAIWSVDKDQPIVRVATMDTCWPHRSRSGASP
jgi:putative ABC transport system permease protein